MSLTRFSVDNPVVLGILAAVVIASGLLASVTLGIVFLPDITAPVIEITASYPGASSAEMEQLVVKPLEDQIAGLHDEDTMQSSVQEGQSLISVQLLLGADVNAALTDVQHRVDAARAYLPTDLDPPVVTKHSVGGGPILSEAVSSTRLTAGALSDLVTTQVESVLRAVPGVDDVVPQGAQASEFHVEPDPQRLAAAGATLSDLYTLLNADNVTYPGGRIAGPAQESSVAVHGEVHTAADLAALPVQVGSKALVRVRDVATTELGHVEPRIVTHADGVGAIVLQVGRGQAGDEVRTTARVRAAFAELARAFPDVSFREIGNAADATAATVFGVGQSLLEGVFLTACVLMLALHAWRSALVVLVALPTSLFATLAAMRLLGFTLDLSSTMGLSLAIGILVDDSIVVLENIHHQFALGRDRRSAAIAGRMQIGTAAVAITLVDVVVFLPIGFASGVVGRVLREFGLVVAFATLVSLLVSFTLTPLLAARWSLRKNEDAVERRLRAITARLGIFAGIYLDVVLPWALARRRFVIASCALLLLGSLALVPLGLIGAEVVPSSENGGLTAALTYPVGTPIGKTEAGTERLAAAIRRAVPVDSVIMTTGTKPDEPSSTEGGNVSTLTIRLPRAHWHDADASVGAIRSLAPLVPGAALVVSADQGAASSSTPVTYAVAGPADADVRLAADRIAAVLRAVPGTTGVSSTTGIRMAQIVVHIDPARCALLDVSPAAAALTGRIATGGIVATRVRTPAALINVLLRDASGRRASAADLARVPVRTNGGSFVRLGDVADLLPTTVQTKISRIDRQRVASVSASLEPGTTVGSVLSVVDAQVAQPGFLPAGTHVIKFGGSKLFADTAKGFAFVLGFSLAGMYVLMVVLFGSLTTPLIVMSTLPLALVGALGALAATHQSLNVFSVISIVMLFGLAAKNGILLVDYANRRLRDGATPAEAIRTAAARRFGPIVMTTSAMILSSLPLALGFAEGAAFRQSMGTVLIGGLVSSLLLTLVLVPVVYAATVRDGAAAGLLPPLAPPEARALIPS